MGPPGNPFWLPWGYLGTPWSPLGPALALLGANFVDLGPPKTFPGGIFIKFHQISLKFHQKIVNFLIVLLQICYPLPSPISPIPLPLQSSKHLSIQVGTAECAERSAAPLCGHGVLDELSSLLSLAQSLPRSQFLCSYTPPKGSPPARAFRRAGQKAPPFLNVDV